MKKIFIGILFFLAFSSYGYCEKNFVPGEVIVKFKEKKGVNNLSSYTASITSLGNKFGLLSYKRAFEMIKEPKFASVWLLKFPEDINVLKVVEEYKKDPNVLYAEPNYIVKALFTPDDPYLNRQWGLNKIKAKDGWDITIGTTSIIIAIIDTGIDLNHPDLFSTSTPFSIDEPKIIKGYDYVNDDFDPDDDHNHGSHVAGIASALTDNGTGGAGVAGYCRILAIKVLNANGYGSASNVAYGIIEAVDRGAKVINLSLGCSDYSETMEDACDYAKDKGVLVIAAAGNSDSDIEVYPAGYSSVMAVAATDLADKKTSFSNYGNWVDISAPGESIFSTTKDGKYASYDGTSMAAPFVAGLAGLLFTHFSTFTAEEIRWIIQMTADTLQEEGLGAGRINVERALKDGDANFAPVITSISLSDTYFSPGTSSGSKDTTILYFSSNEPGTYSVMVDGNIPDGNYTGTLIKTSSSVYWGSFEWNGSYTTGEAQEGIHRMTVTVFDKYGSSASESIPVTIDRTFPEIISLGDNTGGDIFYRDEIIQFILKVDTFDADTMGVLLKGTTDVPMFYIGMGTSEEGYIYQGYYTVKQGDSGTWTVLGYIEDEAGNQATISSNSIIVDGTRVRPAIKARITRIGFIPEKENRPSLSGYTITGSTTESISIEWKNEDLFDGQKIKVTDFERKHIWVGTSTNRNVTLNNSLLYYGLPILDYTKIIPGTSYALKNTMKAGDNVVFSLEAAKIDSELLFGTPIKLQGSLTLPHSNIGTGNLILVSDNKNTWLGTATSGGLFVISNQNLYSGPLVSDYRNISLFNGGKVSPACGGDAKIDIGEVIRSIPLSDDAIDGIGILSGDIAIGDGIYSGVYTIKEGNDTNNAQVIGKFIYNRKSAENSPYQDERQKITIDAIAPNISNNSISPIPFNPYLTNLSIKYNLSEKAWVRVTIKKSNNELIRILESPEAQFGENVTLQWDGRNNANMVVTDAHYKYIIEAEDLAGNKAVEKKGEIILTSVEIAIENLNVSPNPFWPNKKVENTVDVVIDFKAVLKNSAGGKVTDAQLNNLGFDFSFYRYYTTAAGYIYFNRLKAPYGLFNFKVYDQNGNELVLGFYPDLSKGLDIDPWLWNLPYYADGSYYYDYSLGNPSEPDKGDGADNDYGNLVAFNKDINGNYYYDFSYGIKDWDLAEGTYIFRVGAELLSIEWKLTNDSGDTEEKWHAYPYYFGHYGLKGEVIDKEALVKPDEPVVLPDTQAPIVENTNPPAGANFDSGSITSVWATLKEKPDSGGSGIDFTMSEIFLVDKTDQKRGGHQENDGVNKISWVLDVPLNNNSPGSYTIKVKPVDVKENGVLADYQVFTFIMKDITAPNIYGPSPNNGEVVISPFSGFIDVYVSDIGRGNSEIDWNKSSLSLKKGYAPISMVTTYYVTPNTNNNAGKLIGSLTETLSDGTYTISVLAYDGAGNKGSASYGFYLKTISPFVTDPQPPNGSSFLTKYTGTISAWLSEEEGGSGIDVEKSTITLTGPSGRDMPLVKTYEPGTSPYAGRIIGSPTSTLTEAGVYGWKVRAYDYAGHSSMPMILGYTFEIKLVQPNIQNPYPASGANIRAQYLGTISVDISVDTGYPDLNTTTATLSLKKGGSNIPLSTITYQGNNREGKLIGTPTSPLISEGQYTIEASVKDIEGNSKSGQFSFNLLWYSPAISPINLSSPIFSPYSSFGILDTMTISFSADENGTYAITMEGRLINNGRYSQAGSMTSFIWRGTDTNNGTFTEGSHTISVSVTNDGGKTGTNSTTIIIDSISPGISALLVSDYRFSPGTSLTVQDTTDISFSFNEDGTFTIIIGTKTITTGFITKGQTNTYTWNGTGFLEGSHTIVVIAEDSVGNISSKTTSIYIDTTPPKILEIKDNTGGRTFFRDEVITFCLKTDFLDVNEAWCIFGSRTISLIKIQSGFQGSYPVIQEDEGLWDVKGFIIDDAGNCGINNYISFGTITLDGKRENPITGSRIIRLAILPERENRPPLLGPVVSSTTDTLSISYPGEFLTSGQRIKLVDTMGNIWVSKVDGGTITISNSNLYYGEPKANYKTIVINEASVLKSILKGGDGLIVSEEAVRIEGNRSLTFTIATKTTSFLIITSTEIKVGKTILVSGEGSIWKEVVKENGSFTVSNSNLYSGELVSDYRSIASIVVEDVSLATGGIAAYNISVSLKIGLVDNGILECGDIIPGDGIYSGKYTVKEDIDITNALITGHFLYNQNKATNDPYIDLKNTISLDGKRPIITNVSASPLPFNPDKGYLTIKYYTSEPSWVVVNILNNAGVPIKIIKLTQPRFGESVDDLWDGKDDSGHIVPDGLYYYTIDAVDMAGNTAIQAKGEVRVTFVLIKVKDLIISPNPFWPDSDINPSVDFTIKFKVVLENKDGGPPTELQLNNLGFDFIQYGDRLNVPYALLNLSLYDKDNVKIELLNYPDLTASSDSDPWLFGLPEYKDGSHIYNYSIGSPLAPDKGDDNISNDFDNLVPFDKDINGNYSQVFEYGLLDWASPAGEYTVRTSAKLVSIEWELKSAKGASPEVWHAKPYYHGHYGLISDPLDGKVEAMEETPPIPPDKTAPAIDASYPASGDIKNPYDVSYVWARLKDNDGGVGINLVKSTIKLYKSDNSEVSGNQTIVGTNTIYLTLISTLTSPSIYYIKVYAIDKNANSANYSISFEIMDNLAPTISDPYPSGTINAPFSGPITVNISEIGRGESGIAWGTSTISLKKDEISISLTKDYTGAGSNSGTLRGGLFQQLEKSGTYTMTVVACDNKGNMATATFSFYIPVGMYDESDPPEIKLIEKPSVAFVNKEIPIYATIIDRGVGLNYAILYYQGSGIYGTKTMYLSQRGTTTFTENIPKQTTKVKLKYWVWAIDKNGNAAQSETYDITITTKDDISIDKAVYAQPNPAKGNMQFRVLLTESAKVYIDVYAITGELVWEYERNLGATENFIDYNCINKDGGKLGTGLYIYKVTIEYPTRKEETIKKMVIIKQ